MPGGYKNIKPSDRTNGFEKNPQNINRKGQRKKTYSYCIEELEAKGYEMPTQESYYKMIGLMLAMTEEDLKEFAKDTEKPYWIRLLVLDLNDKRNRQRLMEDQRDWLFGKAKQQIDHTTKGDKISFNIGFTEENDND